MRGERPAVDPLLLEKTVPGGALHCCPHRHEVELEAEKVPGEQGMQERELILEEKVLGGQGVATEPNGQYEPGAAMQGEDVMEGVGESVGVTEDVPELLGDNEGVPVFVGDTEGETVGLRVAEGVAEGVGDATVATTLTPWFAPSAM